MAKTGARKKIQKKKAKLEPLNQIAKSKQLLKKRNSKNNRPIINRNNARPCNKRTRENIRLSNDKKRLPSLADLEKMFEEPDEIVMVPSVSETNSTRSESTEIAKTVVRNDLWLPCVVLTDIEPQSTSHGRKNSSTFDDDCDGPSPNKKQKKDLNLNNLEPSVCDSPEMNDSPKSFDSGETIIYDVETSGRFSPLPSTSKDSAKILENEKRFNASLIKSNENLQKNEACSTNLNEESQSDVEVIETPIETITITDEEPSTSWPLLPKPEPVDSGIVIILDDDTTKLNDSEVVHVNHSTNTRNTLENIISLENIGSVNETSILNQVIGNEIIDVENYGDERDIDNIDDFSHSCPVIHFGSHITDLIDDFLTNMDLVLNNSDECIEEPQTEHPTKLKAKGGNSSTSKTKKRNSKSKNISSALNDCPICMDSLSTKDVASTICGHIFCLECMKMSYKKGIRKCPTCRKVLKGVGYHQIFL